MPKVWARYGDHIDGRRREGGELWTWQGTALALEAALRPRLGRNQGDVSEYLPREGQRTWTCTACLKEFLTTRGLEGHERRSHPVQSSESAAS